jgi:hypothetical protein
MPLKDFDMTVLLLRKNDSVGVLRSPVKPGDELVNGSLRFRISQPIGAGHSCSARHFDESVEPGRLHAENHELQTQKATSKT